MGFDFDFDIVNSPFLDGDVARSTSYGVYIFQLIRFARVSSHVPDFNARNKNKNISNDQELIQSDPISCPQNCQTSPTGLSVS